MFRPASAAPNHAGDELQGTLTNIRRMVLRPLEAFVSGHVSFGVSSSVVVLFCSFFPMVR